MAYFGMDRICEIDRCRVLRKSSDFAFWREHKDFPPKEIHVKKFHELLWFCRVLLPLKNLSEPSQCFIRLIHALLVYFVFLISPVRGNTVLSCAMHFLRPNLYLIPPTFWPEHCGMKRAVHVRLWHRDIVVEAFRYRCPFVVDDT